MGKFTDLTGERFGRLTVVGRTTNSNTNRVRYVALCDCGKYVTVHASSLRSGLSRSCGCYKSEQWLKSRTKHGQLSDGHRSKLYRAWNNMKQRCNNPNNPRYADYGGRGIKVCEEWQRDYAKFYDWAIESGYSEELTLDRIDVNGDYTPSNCRWADRVVQANNTRSNRYINIDGEVHTLADWSRIKGVKICTIDRRMRVHGWSERDAILTPVGANV